jgi:hypothetical protein
VATGKTREEVEKNILMVDGVPMEMGEVLRDSVLHRLVNDEDGVMGRVGY